MMKMLFRHDYDYVNLNFVVFLFDEEDVKHGMP